MSCFIVIGLQYRSDSDEHLDRMCLPIAFESQEEAQEYINKNPDLYNKWGALFAYGDIPVDSLFLRNWEAWKKRNNFDLVI